MQKNVKSSAVAGVLGVFLGSCGAHDWYLGNTKKAITHVSLLVGGLILLIIGVILTNLSRDIPVFNMLFFCLVIMSYVIIIGDVIWGFIEGVIILMQGDPGLAAKGYEVAPETVLGGVNMIQPNNTATTSPETASAGNATPANTETTAPAPNAASTAAANDTSAPSGTATAVTPEIPKAPEFKSSNPAEPVTAPAAAPAPTPDPIPVASSEASPVTAGAKPADTTPSAAPEVSAASAAASAPVSPTVSAATSTTSATTQSASPAATPTTDTTPVAPTPEAPGAAPTAN